MFGLLDQTVHYFLIRTGPLCNCNKFIELSTAIVPNNVYNWFHLVAEQTISMTISCAILFVCQEFYLINQYPFSLIIEAGPPRTKSRGGPVQETSRTTS